MLRRLGIRGKLLAALSVPVLVLFALAGTISMQAVEDVRVARTVTELLGALDRARELTVALQEERAATIPLLLADDASRLDARGAMNQSRAQVDKAISAADTAANSIDLASLDPVVDRAVTGLRDQLVALDQLRRAVDSDEMTVRAAFTGYTTVVERVTAFPEVVANALDDRPLATVITAQTAAMQLAEDYRQEQVLGSAVLAGAQTQTDVQELLRLIPATNVQQETVTLLVQQLQLGDDVLVPPLRVGLQSYGSIRALPVSGGNTFFTFITPDQWFELAGSQAAEYDALLGQLDAAGQVRADDVEATAFRTAALTIALTVLAVVISLATALTIARQIVEPLRRLTLAAGQVRDELPRLVEQVSVPGQGPDLALVRIPVDSRDEVGRLAEAFNEVNATTIQVAQEQAALRGSIAEMFVNVARRDQVLLNRQLSFIDALERSEEDPATLADLFRLDHLATRMRRNAESLLVLAGIDTGRRLREPIPVSDVIRTASSEIEHYERIHLDLPVDPSMLGHVALPAAHLLAELLENATVFSDPGTPVQVSTGIDETHVVVTVLDQGLGMTAAELAEANAKIRTTSASDVVGAQRLGLFVVGRIAGRLGAQVELGLGPDGTGTLATVRIPVILFVETASIPLTAPITAAERPSESFAPVEEAAVVVHDTAFAPVPEHVQDVSPGSLGSAENPAEEVDLASLTDGRTGHGLPRRRSRGADSEAPAPSTEYREQDDAAAAPSIPLAPQADALAGAATLPTDEGWAPAVVEAQPLVARRRADDDEAAAPAPLPTRGDALPVREPAATTGEPVVGEAATELPTRALPTRAPGGAGLPSRTPVELVAEATPAVPAGPPESRAAMFSGFRSRRAELAAAAVDQLPDRDDERPAGDGADRLAAAAAFFGRNGDAVADEPEPLVIPALEDDDEFPPSLLGAVEDRPGGRHAYRDDELTWPPAVDAVEDTWAPADDAAPEWTVDTGWQQPVAPAPAAEQDWAAQQPWTPPQQEWAAQQEWAPQQAWTPPQQDWAAAEPAPTVDEHQHAAPAPSWDAQPVAASWDAQPAAATSSWEAGAPAAEDGAADEALEDAASSVSPWSPVTGPTPVVPEPADAPWTAVGDRGDEVLDLLTADAPAAAAADADATVLGAAAPAAAGGAAVAAGAPPKRRWWPFGRAKSRTAPAQPAFEPALEPALEPVGTAPEPSAEAPAWPATTDDVPAPVAPPLRSSAWGPSEAGAHALPPVEPEAPAAPSATPRLGASAFFPAVHATREAGDLLFPEEVPADLGGAPLDEAAHQGGQDVVGEWGLPSPRPMPPQPEPAAEPAVAPAAFVAPAESWAPETWDVPEEPQWRPTMAPPAAPEPAAGGGGGGLGHRTPGATQQSFTPAPLPAFQPATFTPEPTGVSGFDAEVNSALAQRADLAQQALAELSQLSSYRPQTVAGGAGSLTRRTPSAVPAAPEITTRPGVPRPERDANQVRSLLSSFQSGTSRGRMAVDGTQTTGTGTSGTGHEEGPSEREQLAPVPTDSDLTQRSTSW
ncbi:nitrate- and nitrite sensing domain-containing protein [Actinotalea sp. Marseille-Q4924]|uniref:nitrate- and nitrite sensing domain-containing protein n=1 Tax=Actinotalea sp. Marseille-Q4924 TaxID=2866571 RepID=UPI001CE42D9C|nr:nitrate- and nitrite sensing domain-containing protein [Actinotalea sp. Marseille-Q4924]